MDLVLKLLEHLECHGTGREMAPPEIEGYTPGQVEYHVYLCRDAGFVQCNPVAPRNMVRLTWAGHEELERLRRRE